MKTSKEKMLVTKKLPEGESNMKKIILILLIVVTANAFAQTPGEKLAATVMNIWKDTVPIGSTTKWSYDMGVVLKGFQGIWENTANKKYPEKSGYVEHGCNLNVCLKQVL